MSPPAVGLKQQLEAVKGREPQDNLLHHLSNVLTKLLLADPVNAYDLLEDYSHNVKVLKYDYTKHPALKEDSV